MDIRRRNGINFRNMGKGLAIGGLVAVVAAGACGVTTCQHWDRETYKVQVTGTERVNKDDESKYIVFAKDVNTGQDLAFENTDSWLECFFGRCKFDASNLQSQIKAAEKDGSTVEIKTYGWRIPFFSMYENVVSVKKVQ